MTKILPKKKRHILDYLTEYIEDRGFAPTLQDIAAHFKLSSTATVHEHLAYLEEHGFIRKEDGEIEIMDQSGPEPATAKNFFQLPVLGLITAGSPIEAIENKDDTVAVPAELATDDAFILKVKGDSMVESLIADGDYVVIKKQNTANNGDIIVALLEDGSATLKEYHKEADHVRLQPRNKKYEPIIVKNIDIQGKVTGILRAFA